MPTAAQVPTAAQLPGAAQVPRFAADTLCKREQLCRQCTGAACSATTPESPWPEPALAAGQALVLDGIRLLVPAAPERVGHPSGGGLFLRYDGTRMLAFEWIKPGQVPYLKPGPRGSLTLADVPRIDHTQTSQDPEPANLHDRRLWRYALALKDAAHATPGRHFRARRGLAAIYVREATAPERKVFAQVVHDRMAHTYLQLTAVGFDYDDVLRLLATIETRE